MRNVFSRVASFHRDFWKTLATEQSAYSSWKYPDEQRVDEELRLCKSTAKETPL